MKAELRLIAECCRCNFVGARSAPPSVPTDVDWRLFARLAGFHRVGGLVWTALEPISEELPTIVADGLAQGARATVATNLRTALDCSRLLQEFEGAGVPLVFMKGLTVAALAYRAPLAKSAWDVDVLVAADRLAESIALLKAQGFRIVVPESETDLGRWHAAHKDSVWRRDNPDLYIELHPRLVDNPRMLPGVGIGSPTQRVTITDAVSLPTLALAELFAYLCVHGASSAWFRLKWIADLAGLLHRVNTDRIESLYRTSQELGAGRAAGQALLVADAMFGTLEGSGLRASLAEDRATAWLASAALKQLNAGVEPTERRLGTWRIHLTQLFLKPGLRFKAAEFARQVREAMV